MPNGNREEGRMNATKESRTGVVFTIPKLARYLKKPYWKVYRAVQNGIIPSVPSEINTSRRVVLKTDADDIKRSIKAGHPL
jgi:hypothetical protein